MSKIIEKVTKAIFESRNSPLADYRTDIRIKEAHEGAKAAIEALGVIILPKDALPEVGDLVRGEVEDLSKYDSASDSIMDYILYGHVVGVGEEVIDVECDSHVFASIMPDKCKIIQRNNKPVIVGD